MPSSKHSARCVLVLVCLATAAWSFAFGLSSQLLNLDMSERGWDNSAIGWNNGIYYLGIALAAVFVPSLMRSWGNRCSVAGMLLSASTVLLFPWFSQPAAWFGLRFANGMVGAMSLVPLETHLGQGSPPDQRSRQIAWYTVALTLGGALGLGAGLPLHQLGSPFAFCLAAGSAVVGAMLLMAGLPRWSEVAESESTEPHDVPANFLGYGSGWLQGFLEGGLVAFLGLYLLSLGISHDEAGVVMGASLTGVIIFQVPVGWLADRLGRRNVLLGCYAVIAVGLLVLPLSPPGLGLTFWLFLLGACSGALYPLGLGLLSERIPEAGLARAYSLFMALECLGSVLGPIIMGRGRDWFGEAAMFPVALMALGLVLFAWVCSKLARSSSGRRRAKQPDVGDGEINDDAGYVHEGCHKRTGGVAGVKAHAAEYERQH